MAKKGGKKKGGKSVTTTGKDIVEAWRAFQILRMESLKGLEPKRRVLFYRADRIVEDESEPIRKAIGEVQERLANGEIREDDAVAEVTEINEQSVNLNGLPSLTEEEVAEALAPPTAALKAMRTIGFIAD